MGRNTPLRLLVTTTICVFVAEALIMVFLSSIPPLGHWTTVLVDATLIVLLVSPCLYLWLFRPIALQVKARIQAEEVLRESEERFKGYISHAPEAIFVINADGRFIEANNAACDMTGFSTAELLTMLLIDLVAPEGLTAFQTGFDQLKATGQLVAEIRLRCKSGVIIWVSLKAVPVTATRYLVFCSDITETKRLQTLESRADRLELAGRIAGQVAHDFNNLLGPLMAYPEFIREELPGNQTALAYLDDIESAAQQIANINQDLLTMGRRGHYNLEVLNLNRIIQRAIKEIDPCSPAAVIDLDLAEDLRNIKGGGTQIHRVIANLLCNALDAIHSDGRINIRSENYRADGATGTYTSIPAGEYVMLTISDNGCGIEEALIDKIFDPFFTSKSTDKKRGSGLGLSVVDSVMKDHHGFVDLKTTAGEGTSFFLYFPITRETVSTDQAVSYEGGSESVLVVDDESLQRDVSCELLSRLGYRVDSVDNGEKAVDLLKQNQRDLIVLDMIMPPGIDGAETYRRILQIHPMQKAIIVSGYSESDRVRLALELGAGDFIKKPFTLNQIAIAVKKELGRAAKPVGA